MKISTTLRGIVLLLLLFSVTSTGLVFFQLDRMQQDAAVVNSSGIVRGATQRLVKLEMANKPSDELIQRLDLVIRGLVEGNESLGLPKATDEKFIAGMKKVGTEWASLKDEITASRKSGAHAALLEKSESYFSTTNTAVAAAEAYSKRKVTTLKLMQSVLMLLNLALLLGIWFMSSRRISKPLTKLIGIIEHLNVSEKIPESFMTRADEVGGLSRAFQKVMNNIKSLVEDISATSGKLAGSSASLRSVSQEWAASSETSRKSVDDVSEQMENLAAASQEINASVEEVASGAQASAERGTEMAEEVERARIAGEEGMRAVAKVVSSIEGVAEDAERAAGDVKGLGERAREIQSFVTQIGAIADQTNLLALNAAIEAARAGEAGRGFAVVAEEVRKLAEESNIAAKQIADLAGGITKDLDRVVKSSEGNAKDSRESSLLAGETRETIDKMMGGLSRISTGTQDLAAVSEEQAASSEEIASAIQSIATRVSAAASSSETLRGQITEMAASAERVTHDSDMLASLSEKLASLVGAFTREGGKGSKGLVPLKDGKAKQS
jgi:methyl-accepting chemotaxis protein